MTNNWFSNLLPAIENVGTNIAQAAQANPVAKFLIGGAMNTANDIGAGISANQTSNVRNTNNNQALTTAKTLGDQAMKEKDPTKRQALFQQSNDLLNNVGQGAQDVASTFSPDVNQNPLWRGLKSGTEIATGADIVAHPLQTLKGVGQVAKAALHPIQTARAGADILSNLPEIASKTPDLLKSELANPDNFKLQNSEAISKLGNRWLLGQYKNAEDVARNPLDVVTNLKGYGLSSPQDISDASKVITGAPDEASPLQSIVHKKVLQAIANADPVDLSGISSKADQLMEGSTNISGATESKAVNTVRKGLVAAGGADIGNPGMLNDEIMNGAEPTLSGADPNKVFEFSRKLDNLAATANRAAYNKAGELVNPQQQELGRYFSGVSGEIKTRLFTGSTADTNATRMGADAMRLPTSWTPDEIKALSNIGNGKLAQDIPNLTTVGDLRKVESLFTQGGKMADSVISAGEKSPSLTQMASALSAGLHPNVVAPGVFAASTNVGKEGIGNALVSLGNAGVGAPSATLKGSMAVQGVKNLLPVISSSDNQNQSNNNPNQSIIPPSSSSGSTSSIAQDVNSQPIPTSASDIKPLADGSIQPINPYTYKGPDGQTIAISKGEYNSQLSTYKNQITALNKEMSDNPRDFDIQKSNPSKIAAINSQIDSLNSRNETSRALDEPYKNGLIVTSTLSKAKQQIADGGSDILKANGNLNTLATISNGKYSKLAAVLKNLQDTTGVPIFQPGMSPDVIRGNVDQAGKISLYNTYYSYFPSQTGGAQPVAPTSVSQGTLPAINSTYNAPQVPVGQAQSRSGSFQAFQPDPSIRANLGLPPIQ